MQAENVLSVRFEEDGWYVTFKDGSILYLFVDENGLHHRETYRSFHELKTTRGEMLDG